MISFFKILSVWIFLFLLSCNINFSPRETDGFTPEAQVFVDMIMEENPGASYDVNIVEAASSFGFINPVGYVLGIIVENRVILTNTIDSLRNNGTYRFEKASYGDGRGMVDLNFCGIKIKCSNLDSIEIRTDSVIVIPSLSLSDCNLTHLPPEIGKIRTEGLDLSYNNLKELPLEVMSVFDHLPPGTGHIKIQGNPIDKGYWNSLPDTLRNWMKANQGSNY